MSNFINLLDFSDTFFQKLNVLVYTSATQKEIYNKGIVRNFDDVDRSGYYYNDEAPEYQVVLEVDVYNSQGVCVHENVTIAVEFVAFRKNELM